jgi:hypothetical protein
MCGRFGGGAKTELFPEHIAQREVIGVSELPGEHCAI